MEVSGQLHAPAALPSRKEPPVPKEGKIKKALISGGGEENNAYKILLRKYFRIRSTWRTEKCMGR
jgi:hypothetical protein